MAAYAQKLARAGSELEVEIAKATTSVIEVTLYIMRGGGDEG